MTTGDDYPTHKGDRMSSTALATEPYALETMRVGVLQRDDVIAVRMPRDRFVALVEQTLQTAFGHDDERYHKVRGELMLVARTMPRFPLSQWLNTHRGCGCLVGEYLVAGGAQARRELVAAAEEDGLVPTIDNLLMRHPLGQSLRLFGLKIDDAVVGELKAAGVVYCPGRVTYLTGGVESVEIEDAA